MSVSLLDRRTNTRTPLGPGATYAFRTTGGGGEMARFAIVFGPATNSPTGTTADAATTAAGVVLWPNPASHATPVAGGAPNADVTVYDVAGRAVLRPKAAATGAAALTVSTLTKGVYTVKVGAQNRRLMVE